jgi:branched-chain amino acid aminotransferase
VWEGPGSGRASDLIAMTADLKGWQESVSLAIAEQGRHAASPFAGTKTLSWAHNLTMAENAQRQGFDEVILLNERGEVAECTSANIFAVKDGVTYTPPISSGPLPGVTRAVMLEELSVAGAPVEERILRPDDLYLADEVFITSTTRELLPVHQIAGKAIAEGGGNWPVMHRLQDALTAYIQRYIDQAKAA